MKKNIKANLIILDFLQRYTGKTVYFDKLSETDKYAFILTDQYNYHSNIVSPREALDRAVKNADSHREQGYLIYSGRNKKLKISRK